MWPKRNKYNNTAFKPKNELVIMLCVIKEMSVMVPLLNSGMNHTNNALYDFKYHKKFSLPSLNSNWFLDKNEMVVKTQSHKHIPHYELFLNIIKLLI